MLFEPAPKVLRDRVYDLGWAYRRILFGTQACRKRGAYDAEPSGRMHSCEASRERRSVLAECAETPGFDEDGDWPANILSQQMVVYDAGIIRRDVPSAAVPRPPPAVSFEELHLCRRLALEAAQLLHGAPLLSEAQSEWRPFFIARDASAQGAPTTAITDGSIRAAFDGCIFPLALVTVERMHAEGSMGSWPPIALASSADGVAPTAWRRLAAWFAAQPELQTATASWVAIGSFEQARHVEAMREEARRQLAGWPEEAYSMGCALPHLAVALTHAGSLVGVCAVEVHT